MSVSRAEGAKIALALVNRQWGYPREGDELVILEQHSLESEVAWAFSYNTRSFQESGDVMKALMGNGPVIVCKASGQPTLMPSAYSCKTALEAWPANQQRTR